MALYFLRYDYLQSALDYNLFVENCCVGWGGSCLLFVAGDILILFFLGVCTLMTSIFSFYVDFYVFFPFDISSLFNIIFSVILAKRGDTS